MNKKINVYLPSFIARTTVNRCQSSVADFEPDYVTRQGQGENQARNCSRKRLWGEPEHVTIDNRRRRNLALVGLVLASPVHASHVIWFLPQSFWRADSPSTCVRQFFDCMRPGHDLNFFSCASFLPVFGQLE